MNNTPAARPTAFGLVLSVLRDPGIPLLVRARIAAKFLPRFTWNRVKLLGGLSALRLKCVAVQTWNTGVLLPILILCGLLHGREALLDLAERLGLLE